jgi:hypothetical protein
MYRDERAASASNNGPYHAQHYQGTFPPPSPHGRQSKYNPSMMYGYPPNTQTMPSQPRLQSVVTTSFSLEEDRDESSRNGVAMHGSPVQHRQGAIDIGGAWHHENHTQPGWNIPPDRDGRNQHHLDYSNAAKIAPSPRNPSMGHPPFLHRAYSTGNAEYSPSDSQMKRSFFHHARPSDSYSGHLPAEFMPPKRAKMTPSTKREMMPSPQGQHDSFQRATSWEVEAAERGYHRARSFPPPQGWAGPHHQPPSLSPLGHNSRQFSPKGYPQVSPLNETESPSERWHRGPSSPWASPSTPSVRFWDSSAHVNETRDDNGSQRTNKTADREDQDPESNIRRNITFERPHDSGAFHSQSAYHTTGPSVGDKMHLVADAAAAAERNLPAEGQLAIRECSPRGTPDRAGESVLLLALAKDRISLSETLCVVRDNIEVFTATQSDVDAPAPGRKHAVVVGQVGLRCIHCRHTTRASDRVKRAVCYPSSIKRIYRTVIDMKLDHFIHCKFVPGSLKEKLTELKAVHTRSTGTTMQYFIRAAHTLGMEDSANGVCLDRTRSREDLTSPLAVLAPSKKEPIPTHPSMITINHTAHANSMGSSTTSWGGAAQRNDSMSSSDSFDTTASPEYTPLPNFLYHGNIPLSVAEDKTSLSPLRCFLREQVCAFSATEEDIAVRAPTTFSIAVGQVGIGCIHCVKQPSKLRSNRAACFPFSIARIYQSVADIQRFHFGECKMLPPDVKAKFLTLQSASSKGSKGLATRQYWVTSAKKLGLIDTPQGIRFGRDPLKPQASKALSLDILAQVAFSVTTASKQLVLPEDKPCIADFLYVVMEQLQPCRFTEADRNKRRLKDVGCIGVECKHCAGQVDSRKFFWSSVSAVESNFVSVHTHMLECRMVPQGLKDRLTDLKKMRKEQTAALRTGSQKAFFARVWRRLHNDEDSTMSDHPAALTMASEANIQEGVNDVMQKLEVTMSNGLVGLRMASETNIEEGVNDDMQNMQVTSV